MSFHSSPRCGELSAPHGIAVLITAHEPGRALLDLVDALVLAATPAILIVDDGSSDGRQWVLNRVALEPSVHLLRHAKPEGRGAALKTGIQYFLNHLRHYTGLVTVLADGQYEVQDIIHLAYGLTSSPQLVILGSREYRDQSHQLGRHRTRRPPLSARMLRVFMRLFLGLDLIDPRSHLRALPTPLLPQLLRIPGTRSDYELAMLLHIAQAGHPLAERAVAVADSRSLERDYHCIPDSVAFARALIHSAPVETESPLDSLSSERSQDHAERGSKHSRAKQIR